jgi:hypothetical protein
LACLFSVALASDPNEVVRPPSALAKTISPTGKQVTLLKALDSKFGGQLAKLRAKQSADYTVLRDALNEKYTREIVAALTPVQKSSYRKFIRSLRQSYIKSHPEVDADGIFIWGGANLV